MTENTSARIVGYIRIIAILILLGLIGLYAVTYILRGLTNELYFLLASATLVGIALLNLLFAQQQGAKELFHCTLFLFAGMVFIFVGNLVMAGIFYITPDAYFNSIFFVGAGLVFYVLGLRTRSPLLLRSSDEESTKPRFLTGNLVLLIVCVAAVIPLYYFMAFDPFNPTVSIAAMLCSMILASGLAFAFGKSLEDFPILFKLVLIIGFLLLLFSSWVLAVNEIASSDFIGMFAVGITFIIGHFLVHLSPIVGATGS
ncbi:MAG: hypothetical protein ACXAAN_13890 [Candidatus Thorarchaeota archaeon]